MTEPHDVLPDRDPTQPESDPLYEKTREENIRMRQALLDIAGHGITLPATTEVGMTSGELRWYRRGVDSQRSIATEALAEMDARRYRP